VGQMNYFPLAPAFFAVLVGIFIVLVVLIQINVLRYAYTRLGVSSGTVLLLMGSLIGSYINIPVARFPEREVQTAQDLSFFGMHYSVPVVVDWPGTIIAVNVGGAVIPILLSLFLLFTNYLWVRGI